MRSLIIMGVLVVCVGVGCTAPVTPTLLPTPTTNPAALPALTPTVNAATVAVPTAENVVQPTAPITTTDSVAAAALAIASDALSIPQSEFTLVNTPLAVEWADSSLGCPQPGIAYEVTTTPGYLVTLSARGETYNVHTDESGEGLLCLGEGQQAASGGLRDPIVAEFIVQAREQVAVETGLPLDEVILIRSEAVEWSTSALGCAPPEGDDVLNVPTPGYRIEIIAEETLYYFHASQQRMIRCAEPLE